ncbi:MAG: acyl carrier protein [Gammaproteobacteria bacterium]|nr:acyl carrier protein [Gammaproteobacteria bacterium]DAC81999.1 TPA_exp: acyl carrier protein [uncultured Gammaproteobacteria bacterium]
MNKEEIFSVITQNAKEIVPDLDSHEFQWDDKLVDLGANSMDRADIVMMTLESMDMNIPLVEIAKASNIGELAALLHEKQ